MRSSRQDGARLQRTLTVIAEKFKLDLVGNKQPLKIFYV